MGLIVNVLSIKMNMRPRVYTKFTTQNPAWKVRNSTSFTLFIISIGPIIYSDV